MRKIKIAEQIIDLLKVRMVLSDEAWLVLTEMLKKNRKAKLMILVTELLNK